MTKAEELRFSRNGDREGCLVISGGEKLRANRVMAVTSDEFKALIAKNWGLLNRGGSDGSF